MARKINDLGLKYLKRFEGCQLRAYKDSSGILTIGYGITNKTGLLNIEETTEITEEQAEDLLRKALPKYESCVEKYVKVPLSDNQFSALVSFVYNVGCTAFKNSTLLKKLNSGDYNCVPQELMKWTKVKGKELSGLINRRAAEGGLWAKGHFVTSRDIKPEGRNMPMLSHPEVLAPTVGALSWAGNILSGSGPIQWATAFIMICSFGILLCIMAKQVVQKKK